ncbi:MAG: hypothetical protein DRQ78_01165 [Epsilonproteobacteria bacterium]|nr:MAG: hypothetical protein DRQ78_01165 [Campylobacterota bacterium]
MNTPNIFPVLGPMNLVPQAESVPASPLIVVEEVISMKLTIIAITIIPTKIHANSDINVDAVISYS